MVKSLKVSVIAITYRRAWALPYSLTSLVNQTRRPDEVVVVLKPSGDGSEEVISRFS
jgi:glycosyltransferase involved in cell wall biosynthesis